MDSSNKHHNVLFDFIEQDKPKQASKKKVFLILTIIFGCGMFTTSIIILILDDIEITFPTIAFSALLGLIAGMFFAFAMHLFFKGFVDLLNKNDSNDFISTPSSKLGKILTYIPASHQFEKKVIGGHLAVGENGLVFIPHRYNWGQNAQKMEFLWPDVNLVFRSTNASSARLVSWLGLANDRLGVEVEEQSHYFLVNMIDQVVDGINNVMKKREHN